ncbi:hypothetical protein JHK85_004620 [Glycine max]|nr:hypothetical protein JHK85_004620 [Glycine max]
MDADEMRRCKCNLSQKGEATLETLIRVRSWGIVMQEDVSSALKESEGDGFLAIAYFTFSSNIVDHLKSNSLVISNTIDVFIDLFKELAFLTKERDAHSLCGLLPPTFSSQQLQGNQRKKYLEEYMHEISHVYAE